MYAMSYHVKRFAELTKEDQAFAGGKGKMLAQMYQKKYPIPDGFVILSTALKAGKLEADVWQHVCSHVDRIRKKYAHATFAVRSSALSEDSLQASFAGEFETVLNRETDEEIKEAVQVVMQSIHTERVQTYSTTKGLDTDHQIAIVVQLMIPSDISGVLFTADPISGSSNSMIGNYVHGLGEQLVSGESDAHSFELRQTKGVYKGPDELKKYSSRLYRLASKLEKEYGLPQDIEWAIAEGKLYILQARPITTLSIGNVDTYEINYSLSGDYLWTNANVGEAVPDVVTPFTWSVLQYLDEEISVVPGYYLMSGNICGRIYTNISRRLSVFAAFGLNPERALSLIGDVFGNIPKEIKMPIYPFTRWELLQLMVPKLKHYLKEVKTISKLISRQVKHTPEWCEQMKQKIKQCKTGQELKEIWEKELFPFHRNAWWTLLAGGTKAVVTMRLKKKLTKLVGEEDANLLLSHLRGEKELASLGPVIGIAEVLAGDKKKEEYIKQQGHRSPYEFELSIADPSEDSNWLDEQISAFKHSEVDVRQLLQNQEKKYQEAFLRFGQKYPLKKQWLKEQVRLAGEGAQLRESVRTEFIRVHRVIRAFLLRVGEWTELYDDVFFLYLDEVLQLLDGDLQVQGKIKKRKETFQKYKAFPPFPPIIRGRFDPVVWMQDEKRRGDMYDPSLSSIELADEGTIKGFAGAAGIIEGKVRVLRSPEEGSRLQMGEILVAATTNVGWTPLFPKAAAIITDVGAPLSHAAIVARELGIPAVVGCGNATSRLATGDTVIVDGGKGIIQIIKQ
jgi:pyruvate,water dikinase